MSKVPEGWEYVKINDCCKVIRGASPRPIDDPKYFGGNVGWVRISDVTASSKYLKKTTDYLSALGESKSVRVWKGDLIMSCCGTVGRPIIVDMDACIHDGFVQFTKISNFDKEYFYYLLHILTSEFISKAQPGTQINLNTTIVGNTKFPLPPRSEQKKIAEILSSVDRSIEATDNLIAKLTDLKKALMQELFTKGIGHTKFKDSPLGRIPEEWEVVKGEYISSKITKGASPKWQGFDYQSSGMLFVTSENVRDGYLDISNPKFLPIEFHNKLKNSQLQVGDILINIVGASIGRSCRFRGEHVNVNINQAVCLLRLKQPEFSNFISLYLQCDSTINRLLDSQGGSARQNLSLSDIREFEFLMPSFTEQTEIASILSANDSKIEKAQSHLNKLQDMKKGLMQDLLTGKVRVNV